MTIPNSYRPIIGRAISICETTSGGVITAEITNIRIMAYRLCFTSHEPFRTPTLARKKTMGGYSNMSPNMRSIFDEKERYSFMEGMGLSMSEEKLIRNLNVEGKTT